MCSMYWNLHADITCPACGAETKGAQLQTHWMGEGGSCANRYTLGQPVAELAGVTARLPDAGDDFIGSCDDGCGAWIDFGARIENGAVMEVWPIRYQHGAEPSVEVTRG